MAQSDDIDEQLGSFSSVMSRFDSPLPNEEIEKKINAISDWVKEQKEKSAVKEQKEKSAVKEQKEKSAEKEAEERINNVGKVLASIVNAMEKFQSEDPFQIASGTLDIISSTVGLVGGPYGAVVAAVCSCIGAILSASQPTKLSLVEQLADVVHNELVNFNKKLQDQKFTGLSDRVKRQIYFLNEMKRPEDLKDPHMLWEDYTQFLGEVSHRYEEPIPFTYNNHLTKDADVADVVTALVTYCNAYTCLMSLLITAKGRFGDLGDSKSKEMIEKIDDELRFQEVNTKRKLAFLSDGRYLTFLGRLPSEGGKLTKILALTRNRDALRQVEDLRRSLHLSAMADPDTVESAAAKVSRQSVKLKLKGHPTKLNSPWSRIQIVNETKFLMKIKSGTVSWPKSNLQFELDVQPRSSYERYCSWLPFSTGGYLILKCNGAISSVDRPGNDEQIIEFALSNTYVGCRKINIGNKTNSEFTKGSKTYNDMQDGETKTVYWVQGGVHYMARANILKLAVPMQTIHLGLTPYTQYTEYVLWCFVVQDFDPAEVE